jgi:membrane-associated phospholipid phosphatase
MKEDRILKQTVPLSGDTVAKKACFDKASAAVGRGFRRREFLGRFMGVTALSMMGLPGISGKNSEPRAADIEPKSLLPKGASQRRDEAYKIRHDAAVFEKDQPLAPHPDNGDDALFENKIGSYSKGLPHNELGEVDPNAYRQLLAALSSADPAEFEAIPMIGGLKLADPQAAYCFEMEGADSHRLGMLPPPAFSSAWAAGEMVELYWRALMRDVPFIKYGTDPLAVQAAADLSAMSDFRGPKADKAVTLETLFRGNTPGDLTGPYISQFLLRDIPYGAMTIVQRYRTTLAGDDHLTDYGVWLKIQNGMPPATANKIDPTPRYLRNGRDLGEFVHRDFTYQAFLNACLILLGFGRAALDSTSPYLASAIQDGFVTFGAPHILDLVARVTNAALRAAWCQKWLVHRRLRPEMFAGRVHNRVAGMADYRIPSAVLNYYPIHPDVFNSKAADKVFSKTGAYLLPQAYPEGSPLHPSYPSGHAAIAGACVTVLKAFFKESFLIPNPVQANSDGLTLLPVPGPRFTIGGELNKLAANIGLGRDYAGIHWRSDTTESLKLGEAVAMSILQNVKTTTNRDFAGFSLTKFDGTTVTVG